MFRDLQDRVCKGFPRGMSDEELFEILPEFCNDDDKYTVRVAKKGGKTDISLFSQDTPGIH